MALNAPSLQLLAGLSREVAFSTDTAGVVTWSDPRASGLGIVRGVPLESLAAPGTEDRVARLIERVAQEPLDRWEITLVIHGTLQTLAFSGTRCPDGFAFVATLVPSEYGELLAQLAGALGELAAQHREIAQQQHEISHRDAEVQRLNRELGDSDRGMVALHAELDEKSQTLRQASESRSRLVSNVSHEFRTPLNSILGLSRLLLSGVDGALTDEQEKQIGFIRRSAESLSELINDLLDLSKIASGKSRLRATRFTASDLFAALRGMMRPLNSREQVALVFEEPSEDFALESDEAKLAQILRNLVSNALKFTERGEVRVTACHQLDGTARFEVADTGIGIAPEHQDLVFEEFAQIDTPLQRGVKGTGLGLAISRSLAHTLGGTLTLVSAPGAGSTFTVTIPAVHPAVREMQQLGARSELLETGRAPVLVVEDDRQTLFLYEKYLAGSGFCVVSARSIEDARMQVRRSHPAAVVLDIMLEGESSWQFVRELKDDPATRDIPILVVTVTDREDKTRALGADEFYVKPLDRQWLLKKLQLLARRGPVEKVLVIDDDEITRYLLRKLLTDTPYTVLEAPDGAEGIRLARTELPHVIFLDFVMPEMSAFEVIDELKVDPRTRSIPVIVHTSHNLAEEERQRLASATAAILSKQSLSRELAIARIREALVKAGIDPASPK